MVLWFGRKRGERHISREENRVLVHYVVEVGRYHNLFYFLIKYFTRNMSELCFIISSLDIKEIQTYSKGEAGITMNKEYVQQRNVASPLR